MTQPTFEPDDELVEVFSAARRAASSMPPDADGPMDPLAPDRAGLLAVLRELGQRYEMKPYCGDELVPGIRCTLLAGEHKQHRARADSWNQVTWQ